MTPVVAKPVPYQHGFGAILRVLGESFCRKLVDFGGQVRQRAFEIAARARFTLAMDNPPFQFETRGSLDVERSFADLANGGVIVDQVRESALVVRAILAVLENERRFGGMKSDDVRARKRHAILAPQQKSQLIEQLEAFLVVVGPPHFGVQPRDFVRVESPQIRAARSPQIDGQPDGAGGQGNGGGRQSFLFARGFHRPIPP